MIVIKTSVDYIKDYLLYDSNNSIVQGNGHELKDLIFVVHGFKTVSPQ